MSVHSRIEAAQRVRSENFGSRLGLHSVIYPIDFCTSGCTYCGLSAILTKAGSHNVGGQMRPEVFDLILGRLEQHGYRTHELVFGTVADDQDRLAQRVVRWVERARKVAPNSYLIVNCDTLTPDGYRMLRDAGADAVWTFMEVMTPELYAQKHRSGIKADQQLRLEAPLRIRDAGLAVGNALLWGLVPDWRVELDQFVTWAESVGGFDFVATPVLQEVTLSTASAPPEGFDVTPPLVVTPEQYLEICAELRLAFPTSRLVGNTRLPPEFVYGEAAKIVDMCNGYVWAGSRSHPDSALAEPGHHASSATQMNFFNPGESPDEILAMCPEGFEVDARLASVQHERA